MFGEPWALTLNAPVIGANPAVLVSEPTSPAPKKSLIGRFISSALVVWLFVPPVTTLVNIAICLFFPVRYLFNYLLSWYGGL
jgi:hypothetical protein